MFSMPELEFNPFRDRMCAVFSTAENEDASVSFEDFLDMASAMSERAPAQLKADWAFRMFDFDGDGFIGKDDISMVVSRITNDGGGGAGDVEEQQRDQETAAGAQPASKLTGSDIDKIAKNVLAEADLNRSGTINEQEFRHIMSKSPDFAYNFRFRI